MQKALLLMLFILVASFVKANQPFLRKDTIVKNDTTVNLQCINQPTNVIARSIAQQTGRHYLELARGPFKLITITRNGIGMHEAMRMVTKNQPLSFSITQNKIELLPPPVNSERGRVKDTLIRLSGTVVDSNKGEPIAGATVREDTLSGKGTITDAKGNFILDSIAPRGRLCISHINYQSLELPYDHPSALNITLSEAVGLLDSVVSKGYYNTRDRHNTGSVSSVKAEAIDNHPVGDALKGLGGSVSGLLVTQTSGVPGSEVKAIIRGQNSIANGNEPLYVVDGVPLLSFFTQGRMAANQLSILLNIPPEDIESIDVLKDADATSIYGSRGANGVILITTKKAKAGKTAVNVNVYHGFGQSMQRLQLMNTQWYLQLRRQALANDGKEVSPQDHDLNGNWDTTRTTDWQQELIGHTASITQAALSVSGGTTRTQIRAAGGYRRETTVFPGAFHDSRYTGSFAFNHQSENDRFTFSGNINYGASTLNLPQADLTQRTLMAPNAPELYKNGELNWQKNTYLNPLADLKQTSEASANSTRVNSTLSYRVDNDWTLKLFSGFYWASLEEKQLTPFSSFLPTTNDPSNHRIHINAINRINLWILEPQINYSKLLFNHLQTDVIAGATLQQTNDDLQYWLYSGFTSDDFIEDRGRAKDLVASQEETKYRYKAFFLRLGLNYNDKYILNLTGRNDGSSRFGANVRNHSFGAIGAAWLFCEEPFIKKNLRFLSFGKLSGSIGTTGNDQFPDYRYKNIYTITPGYTSTGSEVAQLVNPSISWETTIKRELSLKLGFRRNDIIVQTNAFYNTGTNQLVARDVSHTTGFSVKLDNITTKVINKGLEFELHTRNISRKNFSWSSFLHVTVPHNNLKFYGGKLTPFDTKRIAEGYPLNVRFVYDYMGLDTTQLFTFRDVDKNGVIDESDKIPVRITQRLYGGLSNTLSYKSLTLDVQFQFVAQDGYNDNMGLGEAGRFLQAGSNQPVAVGTGYQRFSASNNDVFEAGLKYRESTISIVNADYIRLKNISLSLTLPNYLTQRMKIQHASIHLKGENIMTLTRFQGRDPETQKYFLPASLPPIRIISFGVQVTL